MFAEISSGDTLDEAALAAAIAEMERREQPNQRNPVTPEQERADAHIDRLLAEGWEFRDAYAEVHGLSEEQLRRQEIRSEVTGNRRQGESLDGTTRRLYSEWVHLQYLAAETATRGHLLTSQAQARGIDPVTLFSGPAANARKWASEDLKRWWADNGRVTYIEFRADMLGRPADVAAAEKPLTTRISGYDRPSETRCDHRWRARRPDPTAGDRLPLQRRRRRLAAGARWRVGTRVPA